MIMEIWHAQVAQQSPAVGMWIGAHAPFTSWRQLGQLWHQAPTLVEQFLRPVTLHPGLQLLYMLRMLGIHKQRDLMRSKSAFHCQAINDFRSRPALG